MEKEDQQKNPDDLTPEERRAHPRKDVRVNKVFSAEIRMPDSEPYKCRLYVADVSGGGLKITSDIHFEKNKPFDLTLCAKTPISFKAIIAWAKDLGAGMHALGVQFIDIDKENKKILDEFIGYYTAKEKSKVYRLNKIIPMRIQYGTIAPEPFYILTLEISLSGMKISHESRLPEDEAICFRIYLDPHARPLEACAKVVSQKLEGEFSQSYIITLEFTEIDRDSNDFLNNFIDNAISNLIEKKISRPVVMFDEDSIM